MNIPRGTPMFFVNKDLEVERYKYLHPYKTYHIIEDYRGVSKRIYSGDLQYYLLSERVALRELEEKLIDKIKLVHDRMREMNESFRPLNAVSNINCKILKTSRKIHQYDINTGDYIESYESTSHAAKALGRSRRSSMLNEAANGIKRKTAYGFMWSFKLVDSMTK